MENNERKTTQAMTKNTADRWMLLKIKCQVKSVNEAMKLAQKLLIEKLNEGGNWKKYT
tara:strand:- start:633 stop:806 length:174 start_codon:yes stop_codon:yes gene_type:complete